MSEIIKSEKVGCAVIGYGGMGGWHVKHLQKSDVAYLCGIYDIKPERAQAAEKNGIRAYNSLDELLADPDVVIVTIATPNECHAPLAKQCLRAGKHVICEKPVTMSLAELDSVIAVANECRRVFSVHQNRRWDVDYRMMKIAYHSQKLGRVFRVESRVQGSRGIPGDWRKEKEHGGGMIYDWGVHLIDQMLGIVDDKKITAVRCLCEHIANDEVDDGFQLDIIFEDGVVGHIEVGTHHFISLPKYYMAGTAGSAVVQDWRDHTKIVSCLDKAENDVKPVVTAAGITKTMAPRSEEVLETSYIERMESDVHDYYRNFIRAIRGEEEQIVTHAQMRRVLKVMEAAFASDAKGKTIKFAEN